VGASPDSVGAQANIVTITFQTGAEGKGLAAGDVDPMFTWNHSGDFSQPRYEARVFNRQGRSLWHDYEKRRTCVMAEGACWKNVYGPDVPPTMPPYDGVEYLYFSFTLPPNATDVELDVPSLGADDRVVLLVNGTEIGGFSSRVTVPTAGVMQAGDGTVTAHTFKPSTQYGTIDAPGLFMLGDVNVLTFWVNNTSSRNLMAPARPHMGDSDPSVLSARGIITYEMPSSTATPSPTTEPTATATAMSPPPEPTPASCVCEFVGSRVPPAVINDAVANPHRYYGWQMRLDPGKPPGPSNPRRVCLSMLNPNTIFHPLWNPPIWRVGCP
jgi:hypothetical protein